MASSLKAQKSKPVVASKPKPKPTNWGPGTVTSTVGGSTVTVPAWVIQKATGYTPSAPAASTPATPASSSSSSGSAGASPDAQYAEATRIAMERRNNQIAKLRSQGLLTLKESGVSGQFDLQDNAGTLNAAIGGLSINDQTLDAAPLSAAAQLRDAYRKNASGSKTSLAARGQLYSGAMNNAQDSLAKGFGDDKQRLIDQVSKALAGYADAGRGAYTDWASENNAAYGELTSRAEAARQAAAAQPVAGGGVASGGIGAPTGQSFKQVMSDKLKGPNGEKLHVTDKGTYYIRKSDGKAIYIKRN